VPGLPAAHHAPGALHRVQHDPQTPPPSGPSSRCPSRCNRPHPLRTVRPVDSTWASSGTSTSSTTVRCGHRAIEGVTARCTLVLVAVADGLTRRMDLCPLRWQARRRHSESIPSECRRRFTYTLPAADNHRDGGHAAWPSEYRISDYAAPGGRVPGRFAVSRCGPHRQENPRPAGAGSANPGFYAESGHCHSVRERTPEVNRKHGQSLYRAFSDGCEHLHAPPPPPPAHTAGARGASDTSPVGRRGKPVWGPPSSPRRM
jgi:hypothetical protein